MPLAATTGSKLIEETNTVLMTIGPFLSEENPRVQRWFKEAAKLVKVDPGDGYMFRAFVYQIIGDAENAIHCIDNAFNLRRNDPTVLANKCGILLNLGRFSEAQKLYKHLGSPKLGLFPYAIRLGAHTGSFRQMAQFIAEARKLELDTSDPLFSQIEASAQVMSTHDISDADVAAVLDVAGEIMMESRVMFIGSMDHFSWDAADAPSISLVLKLPFDAYRCEDLDTELASRIVSRGINSPWMLAVNFASGLTESHERYPERNSVARV